VKPDAAVCQDGEVPLKAESEWEGGGQLGFAVSKVTHQSEMQLTNLMTPPRNATFRLRELPPGNEPLLVDQARLSELPPDPKAKPATGAKQGQPGSAVPSKGLVVKNEYEAPRFLLVNGTLVGWLPPGFQVELGQLKAGAYSLSARDFLGIEPIDRWAQRVPGRRRLGAPKAPEVGPTSPN
jgi:hypothetical protein